MRRRSQLIPWQVAGRVTDEQGSAEEVVKTTGWVFNSESGDTLTLAEFVATGDSEVPVYLERFGLLDGDDDRRVLVEIGCGIGRMTCALTRRFGTVIGCDLDAGFLERCREVVARFGKVERLRTVEVADGRSLRIADDVADIAFSYITLQHCERDDALALVAEAVRVVRPGGRIVLNFRSWSGTDPIVLPLGAVTRGLLRLPIVGIVAVAAAADDPPRMAGQPARSAPGRRPDRGPRERRRRLAQPRPQCPGVGRSARVRRAVRGHQPSPLVARGDRQVTANTCSAAARRR